MPESGEEARETSITINLPSQIDGDVQDVEAATLAELGPVLDNFAEYVDDVCRQLANAERQRIIEDEPNLPAEELAEIYEMSDRARRLTVLKRAAKVLCGAAAELDR